MRVLVTGAGGTLGLALAPALGQAGHEPVLQDVRDVDTEYDFVRGDVRSARDVLEAAHGVDVIVPAAAIHGIHLGDHSTRDFYDVESAVGFQDGDADQLARDPLPVLDTYYPGASQLLRERGVDSLAPITVRYPMDPAKQVLGFEPECNFEQWLDEVRSRPGERADTSPPWP